VPLLHLGPPIFSNYSFLVHHPVNRDDRHLLAQAIASLTSQSLGSRKYHFCGAAVAQQKSGR
jgi:hypothetical protein